MDLVPVQRCLTTVGWSPVRVASSSGGPNHMVTVSPFVTVKEFVCDCKGFEYRGYCSHQKKALESVCWWPLGQWKEDQTDTQRHDKICPHCGGPTHWEMVDAEEI
jgi:hypothetical protein